MADSHQQPNGRPADEDRLDALYLLRQEIRSIQNRARIAGRLIAQLIEADEETQTQEVTDNGNRH